MKGRREIDVARRVLAIFRIGDWNIFAAKQSSRKSIVSTWQNHTVSIFVRPSSAKAEKAVIIIRAAERELQNHSVLLVAMMLVRKLSG